MLVSGPTGVGKSTLLGMVTGLVPRFTGGDARRRRAARRRQHRAHPAARARARDRVRRAGPGRRLRHRHRRGGARLRHGAARPAAGHDAPPGRGDARPARHRRAARPRPAHPLGRRSSSGWRSASVLTMHPRLLVLDEPTSALDPTAAEEVLATLTRLVHDLGVSVLLAEHRLERVVPFADRMCLLHRRRPGARSATPAELLADSPVVPPIVELGRAAGWQPLPLTVRDARRLARDARPVGRRRTTPDRADAPAALTGARRHRHARPHRRRPRASTSTLGAGRVTALMGRNGSGQVVAAVGAPGRRPAARRAGVDVGGRDPAALERADRRGRWSGWCRRPPPTCSTSRPSTRSAPPRRRHRACRAILDRLVPGIPGDRAPARPVRGTAARARPGAGAGGRAPGGAARRADPRPRLRREARAGRHPARPRRRRARGAGGHPRRGVRGAGRRRRGRARRGRGRLVRPGTPGGRRVAGVRAAGHEGARTAVAAGRRGRSAAHGDAHEHARRPRSPRARPRCSAPPRSPG